MAGARTKISILAAIGVLAVSAAQAADYLPPLPPQQPMFVPPPQNFAEGWNLRGFVGAGMNDTYTLDYLRNPANSNNFAFEQNSNSDTFFVGGGVGYEWNNWLRFDVTAEYRAKTQVNAFGSYTLGDGTFGDAYQGYLKSWVFLCNGYVDLGTWNCFTPFVGAGIGAAYNQLANFTDIGIFTSGRGIGRNSSEWNLAWALHAGVAYTVSKNLKVELAYRYLNLGSVTDTIDCIGDCSPDSYKFSNLHSHDIMLGLRWTCCEVGEPPRYTYTPPLRSKG